MSQEVGYAALSFRNNLNTATCEMMHIAQRYSQDDVDIKVNINELIELAVMLRRCADSAEIFASSVIEASGADQMGRLSEEVRGLLEGSN